MRRGKKQHNNTNYHECARESHFKLGFATVLWFLQKLPREHFSAFFFLKRKRRRNNSPVYFRRHNERDTTQQPRRNPRGTAGAVTCLTCPSFFFTRRSLLLETPLCFPSSLYLSLSCSIPVFLSLSLFSSSTAAERATSFSCCSRSNMASRHCACAETYTDISTPTPSQTFAERCREKSCFWPV